LKKTQRGVLATKKGGRRTGQGSDRPSYGKNPIAREATKKASTGKKKGRAAQRREKADRSSQELGK